MILGITKSILVLDAETGSPTQLGPKGRGSANYWADPRTKTFMVGWKWYDSPQPAGVADFEAPEAPVQCFPPDVVAAIEAPASEVMLAAFNCEFDRNALARLGYKTPPEKWLDIMVLAYTLGFNGKLDQVLKQIGLPASKHPRGSQCITQFSKRFKPWWTDPQLWQDFRDYCTDDARIEEMLLQWLLVRLDSPLLLEQTQNVLRQDLIYRRINARGVPVDPRAVAGAQKIMDQEKAQVLEEMKRLTGLANPNGRDQLLNWVRAQGSEMLNLQKDVVQDEIDYQTAHLGDPSADPSRKRIIRVLEMRQTLAKTSTSKYDAMARNLCPWDNRMRDLWQFYGASRTGRVAGRVLNPANLARPRLKDPDLTVECVAEGNHEMLGMLYPEASILETLSWCIRASLQAPEEKLWCVADLTSIESVGLAWLAGCKKILDIFWAGRDSYKTFAAEALGKPYDEITKEERTFHKPGTLGSGYGASGYALVSYAKGMGVELSLEDAQKQVDVFRSEYHEIPHFWKRITNAMRDAIQNPGMLYSVKAVDTFRKILTDPETEEFRYEYTYKDWPRIDFHYNGEFLFGRLPSGRYLTYYKPSLKDKEITKHDGETFTIRNAVHYMGNNQKASGPSWQEVSAHGGLTAENVTQAICRDIMWHGLEQAEADPGLEVIGDVYDEIMTLSNTVDKGALTRLISYMTSRTPWLDETFFLGANGYMKPRYRKD